MSAINSSYLAMIDAGWRSINTAPEGILVWTKIDDADGPRNIQQLRRQGRLWFFGHGSPMYVYYTPTHWKPLKDN